MIRARDKRLGLLDPVGGTRAIGGARTTKAPVRSQQKDLYEVNFRPVAARWNRSV